MRNLSVSYLMNVSINLFNSATVSRDSTNLRFALAFSSEEYRAKQLINKVKLSKVSDSDYLWPASHGPVLVCSTSLFLAGPINRRASEYYFQKFYGISFYLCRLSTNKYLNDQRDRMISLLQQWHNSDDIA